MRYFVSELVVDEECFELRKSGVIVHVEPRVLDFLIYLIRNRHRVVTRLELLDDLWKDSCVVDSVVTRCACLARKLLGDAALIRTIYGRGYRWVAPQMRIVDVETDSRIRSIGSLEALGRARDRDSGREERESRLVKEHRDFSG